uniref:Uncharacterized protein n=1 Tax=viral metagenome TaxID=1070528 RepID=A0A6M3KAQ1_9ZZZZ
MRVVISSPFGKGSTKPDINITGGKYDSPTKVAQAYLEAEKALAKKGGK